MELSNNIFDRFSLENKVIVVMGGSGLIGSVVVKGIIESSGNVISADIFFNEERGNELKQLALQHSVDYQEMKCDISQINSIRNLITAIDNKYGKINGWVNLAYPRTKDYATTKFESITDADWTDNINLHLNGYFRCSQQILEYMKNQGFGNLINYGSIYGILGPNFSIYDGTEMTMPAAYSAIKGGILNLTKYLSTYYGKDGLLVNSLSPGGIFNHQDPSFVDKYAKLTPLNRMGTPDEIAGPTIFLLSDASSYITGQNLVVDGGWSAW